MVRSSGDAVAVSISGLATAAKSVSEGGARDGHPRETAWTSAAPL